MANQISVNSSTGNIQITTSRSVIGTVANVATANFANYAGNVTASNQIFCSATNPSPRISNLSVTGVTGTNSLKWYTVSSAGTAVDTTNYLLVNNTSYYVAQYDGTCESNRTSILVNLGTTPAAPTVAASQGFCYNPSSTPTVASLTASITLGNTLKWY